MTLSCTPDLARWTTRGTLTPPFRGIRIRDAQTSNPRLFMLAFARKEVAAPYWVPFFPSVPCFPLPVLSGTGRCNTHTFRPLDSYSGVRAADKRRRRSAFLVRFFSLLLPPLFTLTSAEWTNKKRLNAVHVSYRKMVEKDYPVPSYLADVSCCIDVEPLSHHPRSDPLKPGLVVWITCK